MSGSSNFLRFDPNLTNTLSDNDYSLNSQRLNGLQGGLAPTSLHNKFYAQVSIMTAALGQALADAGYVVSDADFQGLVDALTLGFGNGGGGGVVLPSKYVGGPPPLYNSTSSITIPAGLSVRNKANTNNIVTIADLTLSFNFAGANGLDAGVKAANTWYYAYLIRKSSDNTVASLLSTVNEAAGGSIVLPAGYDEKAQLAVAYKLDGSSNLMYHRIASGWPYQPLFLYNLNTTVFDTVGPLTVLSNGAATTYTTVNCSSLIPPVSRYGFFNMGMRNQGSGTGYGYIRTTGQLHVGTPFLGTSGNTAGTVIDRYTGLYEVDASQRLDYYKGGAARMGIDVMGYVVTEIK